MNKCLCLGLSLLFVVFSASACDGGRSPALVTAPPLPPAASSQYPPSQWGAVSPDDMLTQPPTSGSSSSGITDNDRAAVLPKLEKKYNGIIPKEWGQKVSGVKTRLDTTDKVVALTFDACGGKGGGGYDAALIDYLTRESIPATLFVNSRWISENMDVFMSLSKNTIFEIENHGAEHRPLTVTGRSAYGIIGTTGVPGVTDEVLPSAVTIDRLTGRYPLFFRSGTDYYDEVAVQIVSDLGEQAIGYSVLGDAGATYTKDEVKKACLSAKPGDIIICHMNHPEKETAEGIMEAVPALRAKGFKFVTLDEYQLK